MVKLNLIKKIRFEKLQMFNYLIKILGWSKDKKILIITHGGICRIINTYFHDMTNNDFF